MGLKIIMFLYRRIFPETLPIITWKTKERFVSYASRHSEDHLEAFIDSKTRSASMVMAIDVILRIRIP